MNARLSKMRERFRRWLYGDTPRTPPLPEEIEEAFRRQTEQQNALHALVTAMHGGKDRNKGWAP